MANNEFWTACGKDESELIVTDVQVSGGRFQKYGYVDAVQAQDQNARRLYFRKTEYGEEEAARIMKETEEWEILVESTEGYDYGYGTRDEDTSYSHRAVREDEILVADGHFAGVVGKNTWGSRSNPTKFGSENRIALIDNWNGEDMLYESSSESFSGDDHESWSSTGYYLRKKKAETE